MKKLADCDTNVVALPQQSAHPRPQWFAFAGIIMPEGIEQHPRLVDGVLDAISSDRFIAYRDWSDQHFRVAFALHSTAKAHARTEAREVANQVMRLIGGSRVFELEVVANEQLLRSDHEATVSELPGDNSIKSGSSDSDKLLPGK